MEFADQLTALIPELRRFARGLASDPAVADDLVQDCLERAISKSHLYDASRPLKAWVYAILRNQFISGLRKSNRVPVVKTIDDLYDFEGQQPPEQEQRLSLTLIAEALDRLPPLHREVIILVGLEEMSYRDVAEITGVPVGTVMSRLSRARSSLRDILETRGQSVLRRVK
jgi:RNA polymerase sigma-70 factor (ECF subfamily)